MGESGQFRFFVFRTDVVHDRYHDVGGGVIFLQNDMQSVVQFVFHKIDFLRICLCQQRQAEGKNEY